MFFATRGGALLFTIEKKKIKTKKYLQLEKLQFEKIKSKKYVQLEKNKN